MFDAPTIEFSYKNDDLGDPLINSYHALALKLATAEEIETIKKYAFAVNDFLKQTMLDCVGEGNWLTGEFVAAGLEDGTVKSYYENQQKVFIDAGRITEEVPVEDYVMFDVMEEAVAANYGA